jgi:NAD(P)-dependent dehydrogenase (short-subunit alcohol dehydrogenase family)
MSQLRSLPTVNVRLPNPGFISELKPTPRGGATRCARPTVAEDAFRRRPYYAGAVDVRNLSGKLAVVTGAGRGIGRQTALALARRGADLALCDVDMEGLQATAASVRSLGRQVRAEQVDVGDADQMRTFAAMVHGGADAVDLLVNNAGVGLGASFVETTLEDWHWIARVNLFGVVHGCHFFIPPMARRGTGGHVVNLASMIGYAPLPAASAYSATKAAVLGLSHALRAELAPRHVGVTAVCPGFINTAIVDTSRVRGVAAKPAIRDKTIAFYRRRNYPPEKVAQRILDAVEHNLAIAPISVEAWASYYISRVAPGLLGLANRAMVRFGGLHG